MLGAMSPHAPPYCAGSVSQLPMPTMGQNPAPQIQVAPLLPPRMPVPQLRPPMEPQLGLAPSVPPYLQMPPPASWGSAGHGWNTPLQPPMPPPLSQYPLSERPRSMSPTPQATVASLAAETDLASQSGRGRASAPQQPSMRRAQSDDALRSTIAERFAGAYEAQIGHLARVAAEEQEVLQKDISSLRNLAYMAQRNAVEQRARTEDARRALGASAQESWNLREAIAQVHAELQAEAAALAVSRAAVQREEHASAELQARARREASELLAHCEAAQRHRRSEEELADELQRELEVARSERIAEAQVAAEGRLRAEAAEASREKALKELASHEEHAMRTLKEAVAALEADFVRERADFRERDRRTLARIQELERELDQRRFPSTASVAIAAWPQRSAASSSPLMSVGAAPARY